MKTNGLRLTVLSWVCVRKDIKIPNLSSPKKTPQFKITTFLLNHSQKICLAYLGAD
jgi:hypothetical protein